MSSYFKLNTSKGTYITFTGSMPDLDGSAGTIAVWCRFSEVTETFTFLQNVNLPSPELIEIKFEKEVSGDLSLTFNVTDSSSSTTISKINNVPLKLNEWQLFTFLIPRIPSGNQSIYIDSVKHADTINAGNSPTGVVTSNSSTIYLGYDVMNPSTSQAGEVDIDGLYFYSNALTSNEIRDLYNRGRGRKITVSEPDLEMGVNFDEISGDIVSTISGNISGVISTNESNVDLVWGQTGGVAVIKPEDIKIYLTSLEPYLEQTNYSQSLGGYISESLIYPETTIASSIGLYDDVITVSDATDLIGLNKVAISSEVMEVQEIESVNINVQNRAVNGIVGYYPSGTILQGVASLFNDTFNSSRKQYRCYAIKNTSTTETAYDLGAYFRESSQNISTTMRLALEEPRSQGITGTSSEWTSSMIIDNSLAGAYEDNLFVDSYLTFLDAPNAGEKRRINSYDGDTGTFVLADSLPVGFDELLYTANINYSVDVSPAQRVRSGIESPVQSDYISSFSEATSRSLEVSAPTLQNLAPGEVIYVWVEREISKASSAYEDNSFVLSFNLGKELQGN